MEITIRNLQTNEEFYEIIELQRIIWRLHNYNDCIPNHIYRAVAEIGGVVLGAYHKKKPVGFLMAMLGKEEAGIFHHSHILGVHPEYVHKNIGYLLKKSHFEKAKKEGIRKITWTYDPLLGPNANLNFSKVGSIVRMYKVNYYGEVMGESELVSGVPSDRFWVEWLIQSNHVKEIMSGQKAGNNLDHFPLVNQVRINNNGLQVMEEFAIPKSSRIAIEIPYNFQDIYDQDKGLANNWRLKTRDLFLESFKKGYTVIDFLHLANKRNFYLLEYNFQIN